MPWSFNRGFWAAGLCFALLFVPVGVRLSPDHAKTRELSVVSLVVKAWLGLSDDGRAFGKEVY